MNAYQIKLEVFEGPMDLLMHLIEKDKLDIYDIPIARITEQYLEYLRRMETFNIEIASEFLVMAATLLQIKSRMLLPKPPAMAETSDEEVDPRQELVNRLVEYRRFKEVSQALGELMEQREHFFTRLPQVFDLPQPLPEGLQLEALIRAFAIVWESSIDDGFALVNREEFSVQDKMQDIIHLLYKANGPLEFNQVMIRKGTRSEVIAAFLALLELIKLQRIVITQTESFAPIYIRLKE